MVYGNLHGLGYRGECLLVRFLLASQVRKLSQEARFGFSLVFVESREETVGFPPSLFGLVEATEFDETVDLLGDRRLLVARVVGVLLERVEFGFDPLVLDETGPVVSLVCSNGHEVPAQDNACHSGRVGEDLLDDRSDFVEPRVRRTTGRP